jgi:hypothetical protein
MAFKLTYTDGQESDYDDDTKWELDDGVLKLGRGDGNWSVLVSPGHWATIELGEGKGKARDDDGGEEEDKDADRSGKDEKEDEKEDDKGKEKKKDDKEDTDAD